MTGETKKPERVDAAAQAIGVLVFMLRDDFGICEKKALRAIKFAYRNIKRQLIAECLTAKRAPLLP